MPKRPYDPFANLPSGNTYILAPSLRTMQPTGAPTPAPNAQEHSVKKPKLSKKDDDARWKAKNDVLKLAIPRLGKMDGTTEHAAKLDNFRKGKAKILKQDVDAKGRVLLGLMTEEEIDALLGEKFSSELDKSLEK